MKNNRFINSITLALGLIAALTASQVHAGNAADEAAWITHLKNINNETIVPSQIHNGVNTYYGFNDQWQALVDEDENGFSLTQNDFKLIKAKLGGSNSKSSTSALNYQTDISDKLVNLRLFYHF